MIRTPADCSDAVEMQRRIALQANGVEKHLRTLKRLVGDVSQREEDLRSCEMVEADITRRKMAKVEIEWCNCFDRQTSRPCIDRCEDLQGPRPDGVGRHDSGELALQDGA